MAQETFGIFSVDELVKDAEQHMDRFDEEGEWLHLHAADGDLNRHLPALVFVEGAEKSRLRLVSYVVRYLEDTDKYQDLENFYEEYRGVMRRADEAVLGN